MLVMEAAWNKISRRAGAEISIRRHFRGLQGLHRQKGKEFRSLKPLKPNLLVIQP
jgi:hypothetical protein